MKATVDLYGAATGHSLNYKNCSLLFGAACPVAVQEQVRGVLKVTSTVFEEKYLGLPTPEGGMSRGKFQTIQAKLLKRMVQWGEFSNGGKEILIKAAAQALPTYVMGVFKLPAGLCEELMKMIREL